MQGPSKNEKQSFIKNYVPADFDYLSAIAKLKQNLNSRRDRWMDKRRN
jgi:hypothetical protein